jgi:mono/diheme cytochrome c family protein
MEGHPAMSMLAALSTGKAVLLGVAVGIALVVLVGAVATGMRRPRRPKGPDIPPAMRSGPSDPDLEVPVREKLYLWGMVAVIVMALWVAAVFLRENVSNANDTKALMVASIERGKLTTEPGTEENQLGFNCERCHGPGLHGGQNVFNGSVVVVPNLQTVCGGASAGHPQIKSLNDIITTIAEGRTGTDMPSWSVRFAGAMDDQQINDLVNYILSIQKVPAAQNVCISAPKPTATASPSGSASPSASPTPSATSSP